MIALNYAKNQKKRILFPLLLTLWTKKIRDVGERGHDGGIAPLPFHKGAMGAEVPFYKSTIGNFMVYQDQLETFLLQLFAHPETSE